MALRLFHVLWQRPLLTLLLMGLLTFSGCVLGFYLCAASHLQAAQALLGQSGPDRDTLAQAQAHLDRCISAWPARAAVWLLAARTARRREAYDDADTFLVAAAARGASVETCDLERLLLAAQQGYLLGNAERLYALVEKGHADRVLILEALARGYENAIRPDEQLASLSRLLELAPDHFQALVWRGQTLLEMRQYEPALADLERAVEIQPASAEAKLSLAEGLHHVGKVVEAIEQYVRLDSRAPHQARRLVGLARCLHDQARLDEAATLLDALLVEQPDHADALVERGRVAFRSGDDRRAAECFKRAVAVAPYRAEAQRLSLALHSQQAGTVQAVAEERARLQELESELGRVTRLKLRLRSNPNDADVRCEIGMALLRIGDEQQARRWLFTALQSNPLHERSRTTLGGMRNPRREPPPPITVPVSSVLARTHRSGEATAEQVQQLCAACHAYPSADTLPREYWRREVRQAFDFFRNSNLRGNFPSLESVARYYETRAPESLLDRSSQRPPTAPLHKVRRGHPLPNQAPFPAVTHVSLTRLTHPVQRDIVVCDVSLGQVLALKTHVEPPAWQTLGNVLAPAHTEVMDLDGDGRQDVLVADLGSFLPSDDRVGSVVWLRGLPGGDFKPVTLLEGVGRVADVQAADFNGDSKLDLVVAAFGWREIGEVLLLENRTTNWDRPTFVPRVVDDRHGAIHVPVADLNGDGRPDFVALFAQEHETVVAFLNEGGDRFRRETIWAAPHPTYGCSGIQLADMDHDGDLDVLLSNGDGLDLLPVLKPYHSIQWLENRGRFPFAHHPLTALCGVERAVASDIDGDDDMDVVGVSFLPPEGVRQRAELQLDAIVVLEQTTPGIFVRRAVETTTCDHFACAVGDLVGDGRMHVVAGNFCLSRAHPIKDAIVTYEMGAAVSKPLKPR